MNNNYEMFENLEGLTDHELLIVAMKSLVIASLAYFKSGASDYKEVARLMDKISNCIGPKIPHDEWLRFKEWFIEKRKQEIGR